MLLFCAYTNVCIYINTLDQRLENDKDKGGARGSIIEVLVVSYDILTNRNVGRQLRGTPIRICIHAYIYIYVFSVKLFVFVLLRRD